MTGLKSPVQADPRRGGSAVQAQIVLEADIGPGSACGGINRDGGIDKWKKPAEGQSEFLVEKCACSAVFLGCGRAGKNPLKRTKSMAGNGTNQIRTLPSGPLEVLIRPPRAGLSRIDLRFLSLCLPGTSASSVIAPSFSSMSNDGGAP